VALDGPNILALEVGCDGNPPNKLFCWVPAVAPKGLLAAVVEGVWAELDVCPKRPVDPLEPVLPKLKVGFDMAIGNFLN